MNTEEKMNKLMKIVDEQMPDEGKLCVHMTLNDGHHDEWSSCHMISKMVPVAYIGAEGCKDMEEYLEALGVTPKSAERLVKEAYEVARDKGSSMGITAPRLNSNMWDCYWALAMCISDYWVTHDGDLNVAAMLAYQYLSDPDR